MDEEAPSTKETGGLIPLFFYDVIGRILPGAILMFGVLLYLDPQSLLTWPKPLVDTFPKDSTAGYTFAALLIFFGIAHLLGIVLGSLSFSVLENLWKWPFELNICRLQKHLGLTSTTVLETRYKAHFGSPLPKGSLNGPSFLCSYYVWRINPKLGLITARADAELLAARSLLFAILLLSVMPVLGQWVKEFPPHVWWHWELSLAPFFIASALYFHHSRKKRVFDRFALFIVVTTKHADLHEHN